MIAHDPKLIGNPGSRYVVSIPVHTGPADNMLGYVSAFMWALLINATYFVASILPFSDRTQRPVEAAYDPLFIWWNISFKSSNYYKCLLPPYVNKHCKDGIIYLESGKKMKYTHMLGVNDYVNFQNNLVRNSYDLIHFIALNRGYTYDIFDYLKDRETLSSYGLTSHTLFPCLFNFLFKMRGDVCSPACRRTAALLRPNERFDHSIIRIGIQIRYASHSPYHFNCIDQLLDKYTTKEVILLLICADEDVQMTAKERYGSRLLLPEGQPANVTHVHDR